jgi:hypothetical protein
MLEEEFIGWGLRGLEQLVEQYWSDVESLLTKVWEYEEARAHKEVLELRKRLRASPGQAVNVLIYHQEPFALAAELAGVNLRDEAHYAQAAQRAGIDLEREDYGR